MAFDAKKNFAASLIAVAPVPSASGTTFSVTAGEGTLFPAAPFNVVVWPAGSNPTAANAEVLRVTSKGTGDNWTATRTQESSVARTIALGDQICAAITAKMITDIETAQAADAVAIATNAATIAAGVTGRTPGGRLTLTTALPVTTADVTAATTLIYTPHLHNVVSLYSGTAWADFTFPELSIAVPATTSQMYDVFVFDNAGTRTLELLAWTNDTTRATALIRQDGHWVKTGALTRLYLGSFRTTAVSGQTEDSATKRYLWNYYNRVPRLLQRTESTASWTYTTATVRQANGAVANQVEIVVGIADTLLDLLLNADSNNATAGTVHSVGIGEDSTTTYAAGAFTTSGGGTNDVVPYAPRLVKYPAIGRHFYSWNEWSAATGSTTWYGAFAGAGATITNGLNGWIHG